MTTLHETCRVELVDQVGGPTAGQPQHVGELSRARVAPVGQCGEGKALARLGNADLGVDALAQLRPETDDLLERCQ